MEAVSKLFTWLNGKKTTIGAAILFIAVFLKEVIGGIWGVNTPELINTIETLNWIGMPLTGVGLFHKSTKK